MLIKIKNNLTNSEKMKIYHQKNNQNKKNFNKLIDLKEEMQIKTKKILEPMNQNYMKCFVDYFSD